MPTATETTPKATTRGFSCRCILCGAEESVRVDLHDLTSFTCTACEDDFTADDVREHVKAWAKVLAWIDTAPEIG